MAAVKGVARSDWQGVVLVCGKCSKRVDGGFGKHGRTPLAKALRKHLGLDKGRKARVGVVETRCLGLCPKGQVTVVETTRPGTWHVVRPGSDVTDVAATLGITDQA